MGTIPADSGSPVFWQQIIGKFSASITSWQTDGEKVETVTDFIFLGSKIIMDSDCSHEIKRHLLPGRKAMTNIDSILYHFANKGRYSQSYGFSSSHVQMWGLDHKVWVLKNWCFWIVEIKPVNPKGNQPWIFIGRTDAEAPILWPPDAKSCLTGKDPDAGKERR